MTGEYHSERQSDGQADLLPRLAYTVEQRRNRIKGDSIIARSEYSRLTQREPQL
jgi:hypothetical protein